TVDLPGTTLTYTFHSDFEVACITLDRQLRQYVNGWMLGTPSEDVVNGTSSSDSIRTYASNDSIHSGLGSDIVFAGSGHDSIYGDAGNDLLIGRAGNDYINGGSGNDKLRGGRGSDILVGEDGDDRLVGHGGNDTLIGGHGHDILKGGDGSDTFVFTKDFGADKIRDFDTSADGDVLDFSEVVDDYSQLLIETSHLDMNTQISVIGSDDYVVLVGISPDMIDLDQHILL
ncbi:MAG: calcium-binding protein, partial [Maritimibacter sp.]